MSIKEIIAAVIIIALLTGLSIPLLMGKGGVILVRKFTTFRNEEEKKKGQRMCRITGAGLLFLDILVLLAFLFNSILPPYFLFILLAAVLGVVVLVYYYQNKIIKELVDMQQEEQKKQQDGK
ncbi:MAG: DUF3784 domain-containing protein [Lachnospiraceae bacterium]|jgi:Ca2+/Na+ antiporter|nr:DUF3784 domain-containing protein [Lachnospiraceae bacterium]MCI1727373.1 DUF3784 domain-containing protein [Lachnospiraceae bacterium]